ncbi:hypothetical protein [Bacillus sp. V3-13]|uniref:hypothetical protein n=1 Tax=Bacillus sp. V3-13 TaxID=2053728 RepID=UPI0015E082D9|nr:hypothetical protein [Bacillus sp. V3-13]
MDNGTLLSSFDKMVLPIIQKRLEQVEDLKQDYYTKKLTRKFNSSFTLCSFAQAGKPCNALHDSGPRKIFKLKPFMRFRYPKEQG